MDSHLLNKIRAVIALRDKGATDGERDAAQQRLTVLLAKHNLTEQDIPTDSFSARGRYQQPQSNRPSDRYRDFEQDFEETLRRFREAHFHAGHQRRRPNRQAQRERERTGAGPHTNPPKKKRAAARERFEKSFGRLISDTAWHVIKEAHTAAVRTYHPSNANAFSRAFYEQAAFMVYDRINGTSPHIHRKKASNFDGMQAGMNFGEKVELSIFDIPDSNE